MKFDQYELKARVIPSIITTMIPLFLFNYFLVNPEIQKLFSDIAKWEVASGITTYIILLYFVIEVNRTLSKFIFEVLYFSGTSKMPTTVYLLYSDNTFSKIFKDRIREKVNADFGILLPNETEEEVDIVEARKQIAEAVSHIKRKMKDDSHILQSNIRYGFFRNLVGGSLVGFFISIINILHAYINETALWTLKLHLFLAAMYIFVIISSRWIIKSHGKSYAFTLLEKYDCS